MSLLLLVSKQPPPVRLHFDRKGCSVPYPGWGACVGCVHRGHVDAGAFPTLHVTWVQGDNEPSLVCLHREVTIHSFAGVDKHLTFGGVDDTTPAHGGVPT